MKKISILFLLCLALSIVFLPITYAKAEETSNPNDTASSNSEAEQTSEEETDINSKAVNEVFCNGNSSLNISNADIDLMAKLVYAESRGEPFDGKVAVASVVLNRVLDKNFPNTISEVIFQPNAFSCVKNNNIVAYPDQSCYDAVMEALRGTDPTNEALFFYNPATTTCSWMKSIDKYNILSIGHHVFFSR